MNKIEKDKIAIAFGAINLLETKFIAVSKNPFEKESPIFDIRLDSKIAVESEQIINTVTLLIKDNSETYVKIVVSISFVVLGLKSIVTYLEEIPSVPDEIYKTINLPSVETTRGILWSVLRGTPYENIILPILGSKTLKRSK